MLISIQRVTPLLALAFLAEVGAINRRSRGLTRSLFTQAAIHLVDSSPVLGLFYRGLVERKGYGRARIALFRKTFSMMRRMLLSGQPYQWLEPSLYMQKLRDFQRELMKDRRPQAV